MTGPRCISTAEVAHRYGVSPSTIKDWRRRGYGPKWIALGRRRVYDETEVQRWLAEQEAATQTRRSA